MMLKGQESVGLQNPDEPITNGAMARIRPTNRPIRMVLPPWRSK